MPYSSRYLEADQGALPTGEILTAAPGDINDFASAPGLALGHARDQPGFAGNCGADGACEGYNGYFLIEGAPRNAVVVSLASAFSGIRADLRTDQPGVVIYSCNWFDGSSSLKASTQGLPGRDKVTRSSCVAIEAQDYVDGINQYVFPLSLLYHQSFSFLASPPLSSSRIYVCEIGVCRRACECVCVGVCSIANGEFNSPEWGRVDAQISGPGDKYTWESSWTFSNL